MYNIYIEAMFISHLKIKMTEIKKTKRLCNLSIQMFDLDN